MSSRRGMTVLTTALLLSACVSARELGTDGRPVYQVREVETAPELLGCRNYDPATMVANGRTRFIETVTVSFIVSPDGTVEPHSLRYRGSSSRRPEVESLAMGCVYNPAERRGEAVYVRTTAVFRLENLNMRPRTGP